MDQARDADRFHGGAALRIRDGINMMAPGTHVSGRASMLGNLVILALAAFPLKIAKGCALEIPRGENRARRRYAYVTRVLTSLSMAANLRDGFLDFAG